MNIIQKLIIIMLLFTYVNSTCNSVLDNYTRTILDMEDYEDDYTYFDDSASKKNCPKREFSNIEKDDMLAYKCCYLRANCKFKFDLDDDDIGNEEYIYNVKACITVDKTSYGMKDKIRKFYEDDCDTYEFECSSSYLKLMLISLIIILL